MVLGQAADFEGIIQQRALKLRPSWLNAFSRLSSWTHSGGSCNRSNHCFYFEGWLELVSISWVAAVPDADIRWIIEHLHMGNVSSEVAHHQQLQSQQSSFELEGWLELASSSWVTAAPGADATSECESLHMGNDAVWRTSYIASHVQLLCGSNENYVCYFSRSICRA